MGLSAHRYARSNLGLDLGELLRSHRRTFRLQENDCGSGSFLLQNDDAQWASVVRGDIVKFFDAGIPSFAMLVEERGKASVSPAEEWGQVTEFRGRGTLAVLDEAVVWPERTDAVSDVAVPPNSEARVFNFSSANFSDLAWGSAVATDYTGQAGSEPQGWPADSPGTWIWDRDTSGNDAPIGDAYFRKSFTLGVNSRVRVHIAGDDLYELWIDNAPVLSEDRWYAGQSRNVEVSLSSGDHLIAIKGTNVNVAKAWVRLGLYTLTADNELDTLIVETDTSWKVLGYPAEAPGFTPGHILEILVDEAQARDALTDVVLGFDRLNDSDGAAWPTTSDVAVRFGTSYLNVARQLAETYIDVAMAVDVLRLEAWVAGTQGGPSGVVLDGSTITSLDLEGEG